MNILVIGSGGREHALAWKLSQSPQCSTLYLASGNAGTAHEPNINNVDIAPSDLQGLLSFAKANAIELTVVGPEAPLVDGIVDLFKANGLHIFGPTQAAAQLEGSKAFCKAFLARHNIPSAAYAEFHDLDEAQRYFAKQPLPIVIKADGLAAGKGVVIVQTREQGEQALIAMLSDNQFGDAGSRVIIESFLHGEEASFICMVDGQNILPLATSQDHKARDDGDQGPNTGGMGAYSPAPVVTDEIHQRIIDQVIRPTVDGMAKEGAPFTGFLYAGLMITPEGGLSVLEYNVRFGDPETQPILSRLRSDFAALCLAGCRGELDQVSADWDPRPALGVVMAAGGYPEAYDKGELITGLDQVGPAAKVFHAGTALNAQGDTVTHGGRVLCVVSLGEDFAAAQAQAYQAVEKIRWNRCYYRRDIGHKALARD